MLKKTDQSMIADYLEDSSNLKGGYADGLYLPENESDIKEILKECASKMIPLTISGGTTGTTGGCIPFGGWILGMEKLNKIKDIDTKGMTAVVAPAVTLEGLGKAIGQGLVYPPDPTESTAFIGGTVATNASGSRSFRFGSTRNWIKRIKVILTTGDVLELKRESNPKSEFLNKFELPKYKSPKGIKSSAGYYSSPGMDLIDLFIGAEGTLGVVTEIEVGLIPAFRETLDVVAFFPSEEKAVDFVFKAKKEKDLLMIEYFDKNSLDLLRPDYPRIPNEAGAAVYLETEITDIDRWSVLLEKYGVDLELVWLGMTEKQKKDLRDFRHSMPEHINEEFKKHNTIKFASDIAVPDDKFIEMLKFYDSRLVPPRAGLVTCDRRLFFVKFGHIGQNHLHVNLVPKTKDDIPLAQALIMEFVKKGISLGGTCSAEHGIGKIKHPYLREMYGDSGISEMVRVKKHFDPSCILNQGNVFPKGMLAS